ncbi:hypothetical protein MD273_07015 [Marinobacter pelagius]|uniref:glycosyltransferase n=1 Tax=Marinobacter sp. C7 TaxID=2951363 RepID=UPI001EEFAEA8|nr:glycosyltransferase [Marinobacter sp. C7]MCG7199470.1 hypothetical protein [Marinobacter sp. C7]
MQKELRTDALWITWERQTRNRSASTYVGAPLLEIIEQNSPRLVRYFKSTWRTLGAVRGYRPNYLIAQNPSVVLSLLVLVIKRFRKCKVIIDAHNSGVYGTGVEGNLLQRVNNYIIRKADAVIVTNSDLARHVKALGGNPIVLPDPLPTLKNTSQEPFHPNNRLKALCITSWSDDEPFSEILNASSRFTGEIDFFFTGNYRKVQTLLPQVIPENVTLLGFVDEDSFQHHLFSSDFCIDLTKRNDCMVCGAYESIAAEKPIILTDTPAQREYFTKGALFCDPTTESIAQEIENMQQNISRLKCEASELKSDILEKEQAQRQPVIEQFYS